MDSDTDTQSKTGEATGGDAGGEGRTYTQEELNRILSRDRKKFQEQLETRPTTEQFEEIQSRLAKVVEEQELAGKSEIETLQLKHARELEKLALKAQHAETESKAKDDAVVAAQSTLRQERMSRAFSGALAKAEVFGPGAGDALAVLMAEVKDVEADGNGAIRASYGSDLIDETPEAIAKKFLEDRPHFATAKGNGAGTSRPNSQQAHHGNVLEMTEDELWAAAGPDPSAKS